MFPDAFPYMKVVDMNFSQVLIIVATICLTIAFVITAGWVTAEGAARDSWLVGGLAAFAAGHIAWTR